MENIIKQSGHVKRDGSLQLVKQHDNLRSFPNAASITTGVPLDKILAVPVTCISLVLTAESLSVQT